MAVEYLENKLQDQGGNPARMLRPDAGGRYPCLALPALPELTQPLPSEVMTVTDVDQTTSGLVDPGFRVFDPDNLLRNVLGIEPEPLPDFDSPALTPMRVPLREATVGAAGVLRRLLP